MNIRQIRQDKGLTIAELAAAVGVSTPHMSQVERGIKNLNNHLLTRVAEALKVSPSQLIAERDSADLSRLEFLYSQLSEDDKNRLAAFAEALAASHK